ncbi:MAG TPA: ornithine cyclodeaminase family protein [Burkholderiales bacterium]|nr:ornithine cyclodeaminase family protein [Burkholderiales bacterium]
MPENPAVLRFISEADTQEILTWPDVIACLATAYRTPEKADATPPRVVARGNKVWLRTLSAVPSSGRHMGVKIIARSRLLRASYLIPLWDQETAELVAVLDGKHITAMRTAGTSAVAVECLMPARSARVAVLGTGSEASAHVSAISAVRKFDSLAVYSPTPGNREAFAERYSAQLGIRCAAVAAAEQAVAGADLIIAAARSRDETPILRGAWLKPGVTIVSIGSTMPEQREIDSEVVRRADAIVVDVAEEVVHETGDMLAARAEGVAFDDKIIELADLVQGKAPGRRSPRDIVMFKSVGSGLQDIAVAQMCFEKACHLNRGTVLPVGLTVKGK